MRTGLSFSLDAEKDAALISWLASHPNVSKVVRDALYLQMGVGSTETLATELLAAIHRIEGELGELKALVSSRSFIRLEGSEKVTIHPDAAWMGRDPSEPVVIADENPSTKVLSVSGMELVTDAVPPAVMANLRKLRGKHEPKS